MLTASMKCDSIFNLFLGLFRRCQVTLLGTSMYCDNIMFLHCFGNHVDAVMHSLVTGTCHCISTKLFLTTPKVVQHESIKQ